VQAMACGAPVVARDTVFNREVLDGAGLLVTPDPHDIAATVLAAQTVFWGAQWLCELVVVGRVVRAAPLAWRAAYVVGLGGWAWLTAVPLTALLTR